ncbi:hypothetical protein NKG60_14625 [Mesorhizobium sp. M1428]|uniref:hypothetical protein n=1 Tax=Mesorhizobium sp. M1428 TaxID=2957102 RepID=UPI00333C957C
MESELGSDRIGRIGEQQFEALCERAEARKAHDINHTDISCDYEKVGLSFEPTPAGLLAALSAACGENPSA